MISAIQFENFMSEFDVSRETTQRLEEYSNLLLKWNRSINLVSRGSLGELWNRHILDSAQLIEAVSEFKNWADMGSGGGLPAVVISILLKEISPSVPVSAIESDTRKCAFLRTVARELDLNISVVEGRIEEVVPQEAEILSARALAPLDQLLEFGLRHRKLDGISLFLKGESTESELTQARKHWHIECETITSRTNQRAQILKIGAYHRV